MKSDRLLGTYAMEKPEPRGPEIYTADVAPRLEDGLLHHLFQPMREPEPFPELGDPQPEQEMEAEL